jgi:putative endonuclease
MADHNDLGNKGEELAQNYLRENNYVISECNWRFGKNEIDIIALDNKTLVIAEVKTRSSRFYGDPEVFVTRAKQRFLIKAAHAYIMKNNLNLETRFDILAVVLNPITSEIHHIKNAFYPMR